MFVFVFIKSVQNVARYFKFSNLEYRPAQNANLVLYIYGLRK